jgi:hypothetical protein
MLIEIILSQENKGWVIEKIAQKLAENIELQQHEVRILEKPTGKARITHWMHYMNVREDEYVKCGINTFMVTHVDDIWKFKKLKNVIKKNFIPIYLSEEHRDYASKKIDSNTFSFFAKPGSDLAEIKRSEIVSITIASHVYPDGRKNEKYLSKIANEIDLNGCHFNLIGKRWSPTATELRKANASVLEYSKEIGNYPSYDEINSIIRSSDLFMYLGFDEGSMGALDAYLLGTRLLISNQGFHREFKGMAVDLFEDYESFKSKFENFIFQNLNFIKDTKSWGWQRYALEHLSIWEQLSNKVSLDGYVGNFPEKLSIRENKYTHKVSRRQLYFSSIKNRCIYVFNKFLKMK